MISAARFLRGKRRFSSAHNSTICQKSNCLRSRDAFDEDLLPRASGSAKEGVDKGGECLHCDYMKRFFPLAQLAAGSWQFSVRKQCGPSLFPSRHSPLAAGYSARGACSAFTLIELLVVVAIIAILAGLTLSTLGYINRKGAESRARGEVAALAAAIDSYKLEFGMYPSNQAGLYRELVGTGTVNSNKVLFEPPPQMATNNKFVDPWGEDYVYSTNATYNIGFYDLYSRAGGTNTNNWIRN